MAKTGHDYDNVFKTLKVRDTRLFIPVINDIFGKSYTAESRIELRTSDGQLVTVGKDGEVDIEGRTGDMHLVVDGDRYVLECQSYKDGETAIRISEYIYITARDAAKRDDSARSEGNVILPFPEFVVIYVKGNRMVPEDTSISCRFPDGRSFDVGRRNVIIGRISKEEILEKRLLPYIPFYPIRYERQLRSGSGLEGLKEDLRYIMEGLREVEKDGEITPWEHEELLGYTRTVIRHMTDGNVAEREVMELMGGVILESPAQQVWDRAIATMQPIIDAKDSEISKLSKERDSERRRADEILKWALAHGYRAT